MNYDRNYKNSVKQGFLLPVKRFFVYATSLSSAKKCNELSPIRGKIRISQLYTEPFLR